MRSIILALGLSLALTGCGGDATSQDEAPAAATETATGISAEVEALWSGDWRVRNPEDGLVVAHVELRVEDGRWTGQYSLTRNFCQSQQPEYSSYCPFAGQGGNWFEIDANEVTLIASDRDPFIRSDEFTLTLISTDGTTISNAAMLADAGRVAIDGSIAPAPR